MPMSGEDDALYFDSIHHASAVVGINTSAMVEAFIQRRPVLTIRDEAFAETQEGTPHFQELRAAAGAALGVAGSLDEHLGQLARGAGRPGGRRGRRRGLPARVRAAAGARPPGDADRRRRDRGGGALTAVYHFVCGPSFRTGEQR